jgi:ElaB/YqjD/DUF883 family membrane-anchored ribosome-binding protein
MTQMADQAGQRTGDQSMVGQAQEKVQEKTQEVRSQASDKLREQVDQRSTMAGQQVTSVADAMRRTGQTMREEGNDAPAKVTDAVAERAERLGDYLTRTDGQRMLDDVEDFARRQPWVMAFGGLVLGIAASRFLKASSEGRYQARERQMSSISGGYEIPATTSSPYEQSREPEVVFEPDPAQTYMGGSQQQGGYGNGR